ncbi:MAG: hypothetical protein HC884_11940 [Chloroflexaceae bacterium]|nr:hypothetical protein [Chloroflexaceae bacterium]
MFSPLIRVVVSLAIAAIMVFQSRTAPSRSYKRRAFASAAVAFGLLTLFNAKTVLDSRTGPWMVAALMLVALLLLISLVLLLLAWRSGEMRPQMERMHQAVERERERRGKGQEPEQGTERQEVGGTQLDEQNLPESTQEYPGCALSDEHTRSD